MIAKTKVAFLNSARQTPFFRIWWINLPGHPAIIADANQPSHESRTILNASLTFAGVMIVLG